MKIKIITYHFALNYGAFWQAYALQTALRDLGEESSFIQYIPVSWYKNGLKHIKGFLGAKFKKNLFKAQRAKQFKACQHLLNIDEDRYNSIRALRAHPPEADIYITGSDQVWHPAWTDGALIPYAYFLDFGRAATRRVSYAASLGGCAYDVLQRDEVRRVLSKFNYISLREVSSQAYISTLTDNTVEVSPDPVFLLASHRYPSWPCQHGLIKKPYGVTYLLHNQYNSVLSLIEHLQSHYQCEIKNLFLGVNDRELRDVSHTFFSPLEWIDAMKSSEFVLTNSYHAVIFSLLYHKPFYVIPTVKAHSQMNARLLDLLCYFKLSDRLIGLDWVKTLHELFSKQINWAFVDRQIAYLRKQGNQFLLKAVS